VLVVTHGGQEQLMTSNDAFFRGLEAPAVLKHGILRRYPDVFASAAGQRSQRVVLLDGYAGRGRYEDGKPGSPMLLLETASRTGSFRNVECVFVEQKQANFDVLSGVVATYGTGLVCKAFHGDLSTYLASILSDATDAALFAFLDPFGTALDYNELTGQILLRPERPPTEVLLHVSVNALRRIAGLLRSRHEILTDADRKTIARVDRFLGGDWWHAIALGANDEEGVATAIAEQLIGMYCQRVGKATGFGWYQFPVTDRPDLASEYFLVLFTRHNYGLWRFNDSLSKAKVEWHEHWRGKANAAVDDKARKIRELEADSGVMTLFDDDVARPGPAYPPYDEKAEAKRWVEVIEGNLAEMFAKGMTFKPMDQIGAIYGDVLGDAREMHVAQAVKNLNEAGITTDPGTTKDIYKRVMRPGPNA
jgi:three-Cys-motif partner protein